MAEFTDCHESIMEALLKVVRSGMIVIESEGVSSDDIACKSAPDPVDGQNPIILFVLGKSGAKIVHSLPNEGLELPDCPL